MARKKAEPKTSVVKIASDLARKAKTISADRGISLSEYLSEAIRVAVERDWPKILKKMVEETEK
jgi:hypothetical protein